MQSRLFRSEEHARALAAVHAGQLALKDASAGALEADTHSKTMRAKDVRYNAEKVSDDNHPDDLRQLFQSGRGVYRINKTWRIRNTGAEDWPDDTKLHHIEGTMQSEHPVYDVEIAKKNQVITAHATFRVPTNVLGVYTSTWRLVSETQAPDGFGDYLQFKFEVFGDYNAEIVEQLTYPIPAGMTKENFNEKVSRVSHGMVFKSWSVRNTGASTWPADTKLVVDDGVKEWLSGAILTTKIEGSVKPGETKKITLELALSAPAAESYDHRSKLRLASSSPKTVFGPLFYCFFRVFKAEAHDLSNNSGLVTAYKKDFTVVFKVKNSGLARWPENTKLQKLESTWKTKKDLIDVDSLEPGDETSIEIEMEGASAHGKTAWQLSCGRPDRRNTREVANAFGPKFVFETTYSPYLAVEGLSSQEIEKPESMGPDLVESGTDVSITKRWLLRNNGVSSWTTGTTLRRIEGNLAAVDDKIEVTPTPTDEIADVQAVFIVPQNPGYYESTWQLATNNGTPFGAKVKSRISVTASKQLTVQISDKMPEDVPPPAQPADSTGALASTEPLDAAATPVCDSQASLPQTPPEMTEEELDRLKAMPFTEAIKQFRLLTRRMDKTRPNYLIVGASPGWDTDPRRYTNAAGKLAVARELFLDDSHVYTMALHKQEYEPTTTDSQAAKTANSRFVQLHFACLLVLGDRDSKPFKVLSKYMPELFDEIIFDWSVYKFVSASTANGLMCFLHAMLKPGGNLIVPYNAYEGGICPKPSSAEIDKMKKKGETAEQVEERIRKATRKARQKVLHDSIDLAFGLDSHDSSRYIPDMEMRNVKSDIFKKLMERQPDAKSDGASTVTLARKEKLLKAANEEAAAADEAATSAEKEKDELYTLLNTSEKLSVIQARLDVYSRIGALFSVNDVLVIWFNQGLGYLAINQPEKARNQIFLGLVNIAMIHEHVDAIVKQMSVNSNLPMSLKKRLYEKILQKIEENGLKLSTKKELYGKVKKLLLKTTSESA